MLEYLEEIMTESATWEVFLNGTHIDTVFFEPECNVPWVYETLVDYCGYDHNIKVYRVD